MWFHCTGSTYHLSSLSHAFDILDDFLLLSLQFPSLSVQFSAGRGQNASWVWWALIRIKVALPHCLVESSLVLPDELLRRFLLPKIWQRHFETAHRIATIYLLPYQFVPGFIISWYARDKSHDKTWHNFDIMINYCTCAINVPEFRPTLECSANKKKEDQHQKLRSFELAYLGCISGLGAPHNLSLQ